jgi:hypothetical protein
MSRLDEAQRAARVDFATVDKRVLPAVVLNRGEWHCQNAKDGAEKLIPLFAASLPWLHFRRDRRCSTLVSAITTRPYLADFENHQHHAPRST